MIANSRWLLVLSAAHVAKALGSSYFKCGGLWFREGVSGLDLGCCLRSFAYLVTVSLLFIRGCLGSLFELWDKLLTVEPCCFLVSCLSCAEEI